MSRIFSHSCNATPRAGVNACANAVFSQNANALPTGGLVRVTKSTPDPIVMCGCNAEIRLDVENTAAVPMSVTLTYSLPSCACFVPSSMTVDGEAAPLQNPITPINLGVLQPGERRSVSYCMRVLGANDACAAVVRYAPVGQEWSGCAAEAARSNFVQIGLSC